MNEESWEAARLIPVSGLGGQQEKERRAASALLAVVGAVKEFGQAIVRGLGAPAGNVSAFCEVPFELADGRRIRVDGVLRVTRGKRVWTLLVEVKTGSAELGQEQVEAYLDAVREQGFDGLLTISNEIVGVAGQHPIKPSGRRFARLPLFHLSWTRILSQALMVKEHQGVSDPDQAWILGELIRYLQYEGSGALSFDDMGRDWPAVRNAVREDTLRRSDAGVDETAARWDQLIQFLCLGLSARLGEVVSPVLPRKERSDPAARVDALSWELVNAGTFSSSIRIPNAVGPIYIKANLRRMIVQASVELDAPELGRSTARLNWLLRQLKNAPEDLRIDVRFPHTRATASDLLGKITENPKAILAEADHAPRSFILTLAGDVGGKRHAGQGGFITDVSALLDTFYREVVHHLTEWTPPAPHLAPSAEEEMQQAKPSKVVTGNRPDAEVGESPGNI
ncbi:MAG: hypothetical protein IIC91_14680 [Chloroflexi bacterium]|nr:hypothetical protein [Chloroflexota bacterium]